MFRVVNGSIFDSSCDFLTNTINTQGAMGAGLALEYRLRIPEMYLLYREMCLNGEIKIGEYWIYNKPNRTQKKVLNFPVKREFAKPSEFGYIIKGLEFFRNNYEKDGIHSIAMPTLGARLGKLDDEAVLDMMREDLSDLQIQIEVYRRYAQDRFTIMVKKHIDRMTALELGRELGINAAEAESINGHIQKCFLISELVSFKKVNLRLIQKIYDLGFTKMYESVLLSF